MTRANTIIGDQITDQHRARVHKRTLTVVMISQILGGAGLAAGISVGALLAEAMLGTDALAGLPSGLFTLGSAAAAYLVGRCSQRLGRRLGLAYGFLAGGLGAAGVVVAAITANVALLFVAFVIYGSGTATNLQARYAGADLALPHRRGFGTSMAMVSTTIGAVAGPNLIEPLGTFAETIGVPSLAGPFLLATVAYTSAGVVLFVFLRPDPYLLARQIAAQQTASHHTAAHSTAMPKAHAAVYVGAIVMVTTQIVMVAIMTMTPVHMSNYDHGLSAIGWVIGAHIAAMWLPSLVTGALVDKIGRTPMVFAAAGTLLAAGLVSAYAPGYSVTWLTIALVLLGLGWNFGLVSGTALVVDGTVAANRPKIQGNVDVLIALSGAAGGTLSGIIMAATTYQALAVVGGCIALITIPALLLRRLEHTPEKLAR